MARPAQQSLPTATELFAPSWRAVKLNLITIIEFTLVPLLVGLGLILFFQETKLLSTAGFTSLDANNPTIGSGTYVAFLVESIVSLLLAPALAITYLASARGEKIDALPAIRESIRYLVRYIGVQIITILAVIIGLALFIVPGVIALKSFLLAPYYVLDRDMGIIEALKASQRDSVGRAWPILSVVLTQASLYITSILPIIGTVVSIALTIAYSVAPSLRYLQITKQSSK